MKTLCNKNDLRKQAREFRNSLAMTGAIKNKSNIIVSKILNSNDFKEASCVAIYLPIKNEIDITGLLHVKDKNFYIPRCNGENLEFCLYKGDKYLNSGTYGILEPINEAVDPQILDIIYIPALMVNEKKYRLGYGKGYYDRFFANNNIRAKKIVIVAKELVSNSFIEDKFDIPADAFLCD